MLQYLLFQDLCVKEKTVKLVEPSLLEVSVLHVTFFEKLALNLTASILKDSIKNCYVINLCLIEKNYVSFC